MKLVYAFAILHGEKVANPADEVGPASIATFVPKDRSLSPAEIRVMLGQLEHVPTLPTIRLGMKLFLLGKAGELAVIAVLQGGFGLVNVIALVQQASA